MAPDWQTTRYLRKRYTQTGESPPDEISDYPDLSGTYVSTTKENDWVITQIEEYVADSAGDVAGFEGTISGRSGECHVNSNRLETSCSMTGTQTETRYGVYFESGSWIRYMTERRESVFVDVSGTETEEHQQWELDAADWDATWPGGIAEWQAAVDARNDWIAADDLYQTWLGDREAWVAEDPENRVPEDYPVPPPPDPGPEPADPGSGRPVEPELNYPPCTYRQDMTISIYDRDGLVEGTEEVPNPRVVSSAPPFDLQGQTAPVLAYELPISYYSWQALVDAWIAEHEDITTAEDSQISDSNCPPESLCHATQRYNPDPDDFLQSEINADWFIFRFKLNKCCGYRSIQSKWLKVLYPQAWLDWFAGGTSDPAPEPAPSATLKAWSWSGTPPLCKGSESGPPHPYDDPTMWSPWSLPIRCPVAFEGEIHNRYYHQLCYGKVWDYMPDVFGAYETSASI